MSKYEDLVAKSENWKDAGDLVEKMRNVRGAADLAKGAKDNAADADTAADELIKKMQALGNAVDGLANGAKGEAIAAKAARDDARRATSEALARKAADAADQHKVKAQQLEEWSSIVKDMLALTSQVIVNPIKKQYAGIVATRAEVGAGTAHRYAERAKQAATGARNIANTAG